MEGTMIGKKGSISDAGHRCVNRCAAVLACVMLATFAGAQSGVTAPATPKPAGSGTPQVNHPVLQLMMAERLARYGDQMKDPLALITAARIKQETGERAARHDVKSTGGVDSANKPARLDTSVKAMLSRARALAGGRADLIALANEVETSRTRGRSEGPHVATTVIRGNALNALPLQFEGGKLAVVGISGDGSTDLDLFIFDEQGKPICVSESDKDDEICRFTPPATGSFRVEVRNLGKIANQYLFVSN